MCPAPPNSPSDGQFAFELLKLLLQVAWADDDVAPEEADALMGYARRSLLSQDKLDLLEKVVARWLEDELGGDTAMVSVANILYPGLTSDEQARGEAPGPRPTLN